MTASNIFSKNAIIFITIFVLIGLALYFLSSILIPFAAGALLAYLFNPVVNKLQNLGISRLLAVVIVFFILFAAILIFILFLLPLIQEQLSTLSRVILQMIIWLQDKLLPRMMQYMDLPMLQVDDVKKILAENVGKASNLAGFAFKTAMQSGRALFEFFTNLILIPVVTFYLLRDWNSLLDNLTHFIPPRSRDKVIQIANECDQVLGAFFRGQFIVMLCLGTIYAIGLSLIGLQIGVVLGFLTGLLSIVPYLGAILGFTAAVIAALVQYGTWSSIAWVVVVFVIGQSIEGMLLTPVLIGDRIGLHPVAVIFAILAGGTLFGFFGVLVALPVTAVIMVLLRHLLSHYHQSALYKS